MFPGVYTELLDTSYGVTSANTTTAFICIMSQKGPDNQLILNGRVDEILTRYGDVDIAKYGQGQKIAIQYLTYANSLYTLRVTPDRTNCSAMNTIYDGLYGNYSKSTIEMREAAYANIGLAINENNETEFIYVGPEDLGTIISTTTSVPPSSPKLNDRYYIPTDVDASGTWAGHEGEVAICNSADPVVWAYKEIDDTSVAVIDNVNMVAAVTYTYLPPVALWRSYENVYMSTDSYATVKDIIYEMPEGDPEDGDAYLICSNPTDTQLAGHEMDVVVYVAELGEWYFEEYNKVFIERDYTFSNDEPTTLEVGDRYIVGDSPTYSDWVGHERMFAEYTDNGWVFLNIEVADPEDTDKFQSVVVDQYISSISTQRMEYKKSNVFVKDVIWTSDTNATFCAYAHRMSQFDDIVTTAEPSEAEERSNIQPFVIFYPLGRGSYYNGMHIRMSLSKRSVHEDEDSEKTLILDIYDTQGGNILKVESFEVSFNPNKKDLSGNSMFIEDVVNKFSNYLRVSIDREKFGEEATFNSTIHTDIDLLFSKYALRTSMSGSSIPPALKHGDDGNIFDKYGNINWEVATALLVRAYMGNIVNPAAKDPQEAYENTILDREEVLLDLVFDAGYPYDVKVAILNLIEARYEDCFGIIDMGDNVSAAEAYKQRTEEGGMGKPFNSRFIAIYEPYSLVYDEYSGRDVWMSPVFHAVRAYALTDRNYGRHNAPAGMIRGQCPQVKKLRYNLNKDVAYQDLFMTYNINPIIMNRDGYVIWNQSTSYLRTSKYQDINVTRMILKIRRDLEQALRNYIFELNDETTWGLISSSVSGYLGNLVSEQAIESFSSSVYASEYDVVRRLAA